MKKVVLVVDDEPAIQRLVQRLLLARGYIVHVASSGEQAIGEILSSSPDLVLLDMKLPGFDGLSVLRTVATARALSLPRFIAFTGGSGEGIPLDVDVLFKPLSGSELVAAVEAAIGKP